MPNAGSLGHGTVHTVLQDSTSSTATGPFPLVSPIQVGSGTTSNAHAVRSTHRLHSISHLDHQADDHACMDTGVASLSPKLGLR